MPGDARPIPFPVSPRLGTLTALFACPAQADALLILAHGAGAGMEHPFMAGISAALARERIATWRYPFPYAEAGRKRPDPPAVLMATVRAAVAAAASHSDLPLVAGGKSMGGRMTSQAAAAAPLPGVRGLVFLGFPLQGQSAAQSPDVRAAHLPKVSVPMLFLQGTRDPMASLDLMRPLCARLPAATLQVIDGADHGFKVTKKVGKSEAQVLQELAAATRAWVADVIAG